MKTELLKEWFDFITDLVLIGGALYLVYVEKLEGESLLAIVYVAKNIIIDRFTRKPAVNVENVENIDASLTETVKEPSGIKPGEDKEQ